MVSDEYVEFPIVEIDPEIQLPVGIFVKISNKHIRLRNTGDTFTAEKYNSFLTKGMKNVYVPKIEAEIFRQWLLDCHKKETTKAQNAIGEEMMEVHHSAQDVKKDLTSLIASDPIQESEVKLFHKKTSEFVKQLAVKKLGRAALVFLNKYSSNISDHSMNVAGLTMFLSLSLNQNHPVILENLYMASLFHDYGKVKIPPKHLEDKNSPLYINAMNVHASAGANALRKMNTLSDPVLMIIEQHHEQYNGEGVPQKLKGSQIYGLAKILSVANIFDNIVSEDKQNMKPDIFKRALRILESDNKRFFDPEILNPCLASLNLLFKDGGVSTLRELQGKMVL